MNSSEAHHRTRTRPTSKGLSRLSGRENGTNTLEFAARRLAQPPGAALDPPLTAVGAAQLRRRSEGGRCARGGGCPSAMARLKRPRRRAWCSSTKLPYYHQAPRGRREPSPLAPLYMYGLEALLPLAARIAVCHWLLIPLSLPPVGSGLFTFTLSAYVKPRRNCGAAGKGPVTAAGRAR